MRHKGCKKRHNWPDEGSAWGLIDVPYTRVVMRRCTKCGAVEYAKQVWIDHPIGGWVQIERSEKKIEL